MKKKILDIFSMLVIVFGVIILIVFITMPIEKIEEAIRLLSVSILFSIFLAGALFNLLRKD